jgi:NAD(P)-dependent dehydrogenase (short-subunit alcohol dehydrogenase family)
MTNAVAGPSPFAAFDLADKVAVVTGASSGLGLRFAQVLHAAGANVVLAARRAERLNSVVAQLPGSLAVPTDIGDEDAVRALMEQVAEHFGGTDILVNNAGAGAVGPAENEPVDRFRHVVEINLIAQFHLAQLAARQMFERGGGSIINVASMFGSIASGYLPLASYAASKGGLTNLTRELAAQWAHRDVRVNALAPGWFASEMTQRRFADEDSMRWIEQKTPMGRPGHAHELDGALIFLASAASSYVTGHMMAVDGGWTIW